MSAEVNDDDHLLRTLTSKIGLALPSTFRDCLSFGASEQGASSDSKSICVVTVFGKCDRSTMASALSSVAASVSLDPFQIGEALGDVLFKHRVITETAKDWDSVPNVEAVFLPERSILVLIVGLPVAFYQLSASTSGIGRQEEVNAFRYLTILFSLSHVLVCVDPCSGLSLRYVTIFKALNQACQKTSSLRSDVLKKLHIFPNNIINPARLCVPRLLFVFDCRRQQLSGVGSEGGSISKKIRDMRHALEDQTYRILRHAHVVHPNSISKGLVSIPNNEEFVAVIIAPSPADSGEGVSSTSTANALLMSMISSSTPVITAASNIAKSPVPPLQSSRPSSGGTNSFHRAREFIYRHVEHLQGESLRSSSSAAANVPYMCSLRDWVRTFIALDKALSSSQALVRSMDRFLFVNSSFSESLCKQALESAKAIYAEGLPRYYSLAVHEERMMAAKDHFFGKARSSVLSDRYLRSLEEYCNSVFSIERRLCERVSIFGSVCTLPLHRLPEDDDSDDENNLPVRAHVCNVISKAACNCGRIQAERDDPFTSLEANFDFYHQLEEGCCRSLLHVPLHVVRKRHKPAKKSLLTPSAGATESISDIGGTPADQRSVDSTEIDSDHPQTISTHVPSPNSSSLSPISPKETIASSWSLLSLGPFSVYSSNRGLADFPGFVNGAQWLLPIGIGLNDEAVSIGRPGPMGGSASASSGGRGQQTPANSRGGNSGGAPSAAAAVVVYLGVEFECPKGHRYLIETAEKVQRVPLNSSGSPSMAPSRGGNGRNAAESSFTPALCLSDIPLFFSCCQCPSKAPSSGQLMRLYVLVPPQSPSSVGVSLAVRVQASRSFVFTPLQQDGAEEADDSAEIPLAANNLWVLRFPLVYTNRNNSAVDANDQEVPILPVDHADYANFRLHSNFLHFHLPNS